MYRTLVVVVLATLLIGADEGGCGDSSDPVPLPLVECTPDSCTGCCQGTTCIAGTATSACGNSGVFCSACLGLTICNVERRECEVDSAALIAIQPTQAVLSPRDPTDDSDWDLDGSVPDVVVELRCPNPGGEPLVTRTPEISSLTPQWTTGGCSVSAELLLTHPIEIKVFDIDTLFDDEVATLSHTLTREELKVGTISVSMSPAINSLTLTFTRAR